MQRRIYGLETEFGIVCTENGKRTLSPDEVARYLFKKVVSWGRSSNVFLANGARLYLDVGSHPEYATPECDDITELLAHDKAGERILEQLVKTSQLKLAEEQIPGSIAVFKNNTDSAGNSFGCHENYSVPRDVGLEKYDQVLIPFLISRQIYAGAGKVLRTPRGSLYLVSQRADHIWESVSSSTTRSRPIINSRDEPHADPEKYRRLHVIVGDTNMNEYASFLKVGACSIILRMLEDPGVVLRDMTLENPIKAIRQISQDLTCKKPVKLANGREASPLQIQSEYLQRALRYAEFNELTKDEAKALKMWEETVSGIEKDPFSLTRTLDWVTKYHLIEKLRARHGLSLSDDRVAMVDLQYHDIRREKSLFYKIQNRGLVERMCTEDQIISAMDTPPQTTRAKLRGDFVRAARERRRSVTVDWMRFRIDDDAHPTVVCKDPFSASDRRVEGLIRSL